MSALLSSTATNGSSKNNTNMSASNQKTIEQTYQKKNQLGYGAQHEQIDDCWGVGVGISDGGLQQISFVNAVSTTKRGGHIKYIADLMAKKLQAIVKKRNKGKAETKTNQIKNHLAIFVNSLVGNPTFDSQTKENMTIKPSTFVSVKLSGKFVKLIKKSGVANSIMSYAKFKQNQALKRMGSTK